MLYLQCQTIIIIRKQGKAPKAPLQIYNKIIIITRKVAKIAKYGREEKES